MFVDFVLFFESNTATGTAVAKTESSMADGGYNLPCGLYGGLFLETRPTRAIY